MNYIKEMNALYDRQEQTPISGSAIALWSALMNINNKTRWKNTFTSPASVLQLKAGLSASSFKRARAEFEKLGYIEVESQGRGKAPIYTMYSLVVEVYEESVVENSGECYFYVEENKEVANREVEVRMTQPVAGSSNQGMNHSTFQQVSREEVPPVSPQQVVSDKNHVMDYLPTQQVDQEVTHVPNHLPDHHADHLPNQEPAPLVKQYITKQNQKI